MGKMGKALQVFAAFSSSFGSFQMGLLTMWPSYTLNQLSSENTTILDEPMTEFQSSMLGGLPSLGAMFGTALIPHMIALIGRKKTGLMIALPYVISWIIILTTSSAKVILFARFLGGISGGAFFAFSPIFISEISEDSIRGALASGPVTFYSSGSLGSYLFGWFLDYDTVIWCFLASSILSASLFIFITESPMYFLRNNRNEVVAFKGQGGAVRAQAQGHPQTLTRKPQTEHAKMFSAFRMVFGINSKLRQAINHIFLVLEDAKKALAHYRGKSPNSKDVLEELMRMKAQIIVDGPVTAESHQIELGEKEKSGSAGSVQIAEGPSSTKKDKLATIKLLFLSTASRRAFIIVATSIIMQMMMGMQPLLVYAQTVFDEAVPNLSSDLCSVLLGLTTIVGCVITVLIADKAGRRVLIISSSVLAGICMIFLSVLLQTAFLPASVSAVVMLIYCITYNYGAGIVPFVLLAEMFISEVQGLASFLLLEICWLLNFATISIFPYLIKYLGMHGVFLLFGVFALLNAVISFLNIPETKGLSILKIQDKLLNKKSILLRWC